MLSRFTPIISNCKIGQQKYGVQYGANILYNNLIKYKTLKKPQYVSVTSTHDYQVLYDTLIQTHKPLLLGGDHSIAQSSLMSVIFKHSDVKVIWIDAHADANTSGSSLSKNRHGMPISGCVGLDPLWFRPYSSRLLNHHNLIYVGLRDLDEYEKNFLMKYKIKQFNSYECIKYIQEHRNSRYHISFDVDALDPSIMDSTGCLAKNGLYPQEVSNIIKQCGINLMSMDITEFNPMLGDYKKSMETLHKIFS